MDNGARASSESSSSSQQMLSLADTAKKTESEGFTANEAAVAEAPMIKSEIVEWTKQFNRLGRDPTNDCDREIPPAAEHSAVKSEIVEWTKQYNRRRVRSLFRQTAAAAASNVQQRGGWYWHLAEDGGFMTIDSATQVSISKEVSSTIALRGTRRRLSTERTVAGCPERPTFLLPFPTGSTRDSPSPAGSGSHATVGKPKTIGGDGDPNSHPNRGRWYWLLEPDGSNATIRSTPLATRKRSPGLDNSSTTNKGDLPAAPRPHRRCHGGDTDAVQKKIDNVRGVSKRRSSWYWLPAEDDSHAASSDIQASMTIGRKRRRLSLKPSFHNPSSFHGAGSDTRKLSENDENDSESPVCDLPSSAHEKRWKEQFERLVSYKQKHKTVNIPIKATKLGRWVMKQRQNYKHGKLSADRIARLESVGFVWRLKEKPTWTEMYDRLVIYNKKHSTSDVPVSVPKLGSWVSWQRANYKVGKLSKEQVTLLESIGFQWKLKKTPPKIDWDDMYDRLVDYKLKFGTARVPFTYEDDLQLGYWVSRQRSHCKEKYRVDRLNQIGFEWLSLIEADWMAMYSRLLSYKKKFNTTCVPFHYKDDTKLGLWVCTQRRHCKEKHRIDLLNKIGFDWDPRGVRTMRFPH